MGVLEQKGPCWSQPHISAGRVPSQLGSLFVEILRSPRRGALQLGVTAGYEPEWRHLVICPDSIWPAAGRISGCSQPDSTRPNGLQSAAGSNAGLVAGRGSALIFVGTEGVWPAASNCAA